MKAAINYRALIPYFFCILAYSFASIMNTRLIGEILVLREVSYNTLENMYFYDILGYFLAAALLLISSSYFNFWKIVAFNLLIYILCVFSLGLFDFPIRLMELYSMIYSGTNLVIITILLCYIFNDEKILNINALSTFFLSMCSAYFGVEYFLSKDNNAEALGNVSQIHRLLILNIIPIAIFLFIFTFGTSFKSSLKKVTINNLSVLKNIELELLSVFTIFYILMTIFFGYDIYALTDSLLMISVSEAKYYIFIAMIITAIFTPKYIFKYNAHKINIACISLLLIMFLSMPLWGVSFFLDSICWFVIGMVLYIFFWSNLFIIAEKFSSPYLQLTILLYILSASIGYYCGYLTIDIEEDTVGKNSFLIAICFVLVVLLIYYFYAYRKNNYKKW